MQILWRQHNQLDRTFYHTSVAIFCLYLTIKNIYVLKYWFLFYLIPGGNFQNEIGKTEIFCMWNVINGSLNHTLNGDLFIFSKAL